MPKQTYLPVILFLLFILMPGAAFSARPIQTAQRIIMLDPGHGGSQNGLISPAGLKEKNVTLTLAKKTARKLETQYNVLLTRNSDINLSAEERMSLANQQKAAVFISIHLNRSNIPAAFFYYFDISNALGNTKNEPADTWISASLKHKSQNRQVAKQFSQIFSTRSPEIKTYIKQMPTIILQGATMPALLIEPLSISDLPSHPTKLETVLELYAQLIADCIDHYFKNQ